MRVFDPILDCDLFGDVTARGVGNLDLAAAPAEAGFRITDRVLFCRKDRLNAFAASAIAAEASRNFIGK